MAPPRVPQAGVWCPAVTFFDPTTDTLDLASQKKYYAYLSRWLTGLVILGTNAETFLLTREERFQLLVVAREAVGPDYPLMAGVGGHSSRQVVEYIKDAYEAGANYVLVLPPAYFGKATTPSVVRSFFDDIASCSPLPVVIYNFPGVCNGIDLDSELIASIALKHSIVVGVKLTCASVGKITRLAATLAPEKFSIFGGQSDFLIGGLTVGSAGCIAAFANVFPKATAKIFALYQEGNLDQAMKIQQKAALAESPCKSGIAVTKYAASIFSARAAGIKGAEDKLRPRRPYEAPTEATKEKVKKAMAEIAAVEAGL
ncbi:hypothetical protein FQN57_006267 [Myotisia sp. PD_48]|nr:hypothetical protein FQN57_006267 [Myotisia sp. PD_48]